MDCCWNYTQEILPWTQQRRKFTRHKPVVSRSHRAKASGTQYGVEFIEYFYAIILVLCRNRSIPYWNRFQSSPKSRSSERLEYRCAHHWGVLEMSFLRTSWQITPHTCAYVYPTGRSACWNAGEHKHHCVYVALERGAWQCGGFSRSRNLVNNICIGLSRSCF